jgi:hypothetical protein
METLYTRYKSFLPFIVGAALLDQIEWVKKVCKGVPDGPDTELEAWRAMMLAEGIDTTTIDNIGHWPDFHCKFETFTKAPGDTNHLPMGYDLSSDSGDDLEHVAAFVSAFLKKFDTQGIMHFMLTWSDTVEPAKLDEFGGGVLFITAKETVWVTTGTIADQLLNGWRPNFQDLPAFAVPAVTNDLSLYFNPHPQERDHHVR